MYPDRFHVTDNNERDEEAEGRPVRPSVSRIPDYGTSRAPNFLRPPPLPADGRQLHRATTSSARQIVRADSWPQAPGVQTYQASVMFAFFDSEIWAPKDIFLPVCLLPVWVPKDILLPLLSVWLILHNPLGTPMAIRTRTDRELLVLLVRLVVIAGMNRLIITVYLPPAVIVMEDATLNMSAIRRNLRPRIKFNQEPCMNSEVPSNCGKRFNRPSGLRIHFTIHTGEKPFVCPEEGCHKLFNVRSNMLRHFRQFHQSNSEGSTDSSEDGDSGRESREEE
ncbi:hypothetical protein FB446DRAFT_700853 [Lentinula raphanica]|nr:hypothetical protein FB446DRAFT_700853 [Lentinula raphanica]